jgi:hypothetical protein
VTRRIRWAEARGLVADQQGGVGRRRHRSSGFCLGGAALVQHIGATSKGGEPEGGGPEKKGAAVHERCPFGKTRQTRIAAKAASDR